MRIDQPAPHLQRHIVRIGDLHDQLVVNCSLDDLDWAFQSLLQQSETGFSYYHFCQVLDIMIGFDFDVTVDVLVFEGLFEFLKYVFQLTTLLHFGGVFDCNLLHLVGLEFVLRSPLGLYLGDIGDYRNEAVLLLEGREYVG